MQTAIFLQAMIKLLSYLLLAASFILIAQSCSKKEEKIDYSVVEGFGPDDHYFSINEFVLDQFATLRGQPIVLTTASTVDGKLDSAYVPLEHIAWARVFEAVQEADISKRKYLGKYTYTQFYDSSNGRMNVFYEAKDPEQAMRKMVMIADPYENNKINSVYVQYAKGEVSRWLFYEPQRYLRFLEEDKDHKPQSTKLEYFFRSL